MKSKRGAFCISPEERRQIISFAKDWASDVDGDRASFKERLEHVRLHKLRRDIGIPMVMPKQLTT